MSLLRHIFCISKAVGAMSLSSANTSSNGSLAQVRPLVPGQALSSIASSTSYALTINNSTKDKATSTSLGLGSYILSGLGSLSSPPEASSDSPGQTLQKDAIKISSNQDDFSDESTQDASGLSTTFTTSSTSLVEDLQIMSQIIDTTGTGYLYAMTCNSLSEQWFQAMNASTTFPSITVAPTQTAVVTIPRPTCSFDQDDCNSLWDGYLAKSAAYATNTYIPQSIKDLLVYDSPLCGDQQTASSSTTLDSDTTTTSALIWNVSSTGTGSQYASTCNALSQQWLTSSTSFWWIQESAKYTYFVTTAIDTRDGTSYSADTVATCDGITRYVGDLYSTPIPATTTVIQNTSTMTRMNDLSYDVPSPDCTIQASDCNALWNSWSAAQSSAMMTSSYISESFVTENPYPVCYDRTYASLNVTTTTYASCYSCSISANEVQMYYWPSIAIGDICNRRYTTQGPTIPGSPNTAILGNLTLTSPSIYLSFSGLRAQWRRNEPCGSTIVNALVSMRPQEASTLRYSHVTDCSTCKAGPRHMLPAGAFALNPEDFAGSVPYDAWISQRVIANPIGDSAIIDSLYSPMVSVPSQLRMLQSVWSSCEYDISGVWDPPHALLQARTIAGVSEGPTTSTAPVETSHAAQPSSMPPSPHASSTVLSTSGPFVSTSYESPVLQSSASRSSTSNAVLPPSASHSLADPGSIIVSIIRQITSIRVPSSIASSADPQSLPTSRIGAVIPVNAGSVTAIVSDGKIALGSEALAPGQVTTISGEAVSVEQTGIVVGGSTFTFSAVENPAPATMWKPSNPALVTIGNHSFAVSRAGDAIVLNNPSSSIMLAPGATADVANHKVVLLPNSLAFAIDGSSTIPLLDVFATTRDAATLVAHGNTITALPASGGSIVLLAGSSKTTISAGAVVNFVNEVVTALSDGSGIVIQGLWSATFGDPDLRATRTKVVEGATATLTIHNHAITAVAQSDGPVVLLAGSSTTTVSAGSVITFAGAVLSVLANGSAIAAQGIATVTFGGLDPQSSSTDLSGGAALYAGASRRHLPMALPLPWTELLIVWAAMLDRHW